MDNPPDYGDFKHISEVLTPLRTLRDAGDAWNKDTGLSFAITNLSKVTALCQKMDEIRDKDPKIAKKLIKAIKALMSNGNNTIRDISNGQDRYVLYESDFKHFGFESLASTLTGMTEEIYGYKKLDSLANDNKSAPHTIVSRIAKLLGKSESRKDGNNDNPTLHSNVLLAFLEDLQKQMGKNFPPELEENLNAEKINIEHYKSPLLNFISNLERHGIKRVSNRLHSGTFTIVLETNDNQIIRIIRAKSKEIQSLPPTVLQPLYTIDDIDGYCVQIMPKVHTLRELSESVELQKLYGLERDYQYEKAHKNIEYDIYDYVDKRIEGFVKQLKADSYKYGCYAWDIDGKATKRNIGIILDENGKVVPVIIDLDAASSINNPLLEEAYFDRRNMLEKIKYLATTDTDYLAAQKAHVKSLGLEYSSIKGVWDDKKLQAELEDFAEKRKGQKKIDAEKELDYPQKPLWTEIVGAGISPSELGDKIKQTPKSSKGFCHDIREQLEAKGAIPARHL